MKQEEDEQEQQEGNEETGEYVHETSSEQAYHFKTNLAMSHQINDVYNSTKG